VENNVSPVCLQCRPDDHDGLFNLLTHRHMNSLR